MRSSVFRGSVLLAAMVAAQAVYAQEATWLDHYRRGEQALKERNWAEAIEQLARAVELNPAPSRQINRESGSYYPYLRLGIAYYNLGQNEAAIATFDIEQRYREISATPSEMSNLETFRELATDARRRPDEQALLHHG